MVCQAAVGQGEDGLGPKAFALVTPTLVVGPTDEVRAQVVMVMPMSWATATARAPDGGRLIDHHQHQALVDLSQLVLVVGQGPLEDLPPVPAQGRGPVVRLADARCR